MTGPDGFVRDADTLPAPVDRLIQVGSFTEDLLFETSTATGAPVITPANPPSLLLSASFGDISSSVAPAPVVRHIDGSELVEDFELGDGVVLTVTGAPPPLTVTLPSFAEESVTTSPAVSVASQPVVVGYTVPDRSSSPAAARITPYTGGDKTACPDSTAGLQAFLDNETPSDAVVILPFDVRVDGTLRLRGTRTLSWQTPGIRPRIFRALIFPWRVVPDLRQTVNGVAWPWYNPNGKCSQWQYDWRGGQDNAYLADPNDSTANPYGMNVQSGAAKGSGTSVGGYDVCDERWMPNATSPVVNPAWDGKHLTAVAPVTVAGKSWAGYPAGPIWSQSDVGKRLRVLVNSGLNGVYNKTITAVDPDGRTVRWGDTMNVINSIWVSWTLLWCINDFNGAGWKVEMQSNVGYNPTYVNGDTRPNRSDHFDFALGRCIARNNMNPVVDMGAGTSLVGIEVVGPNVKAGQSQETIPDEHDIPCRNGILNFEVSDPLIQEFAHLVTTDIASPPTCTIDQCSFHHAFGDAHAGNVHMTGTRLSSTGRQGMTLHYNNIYVDHCVFEDHKHSAFDLEDPSHTINGPTFTNNTLGGPHGCSLSTPVNNFTFSGNHSTNADITAGTIASTTNPQRSINWGAGVDGDVGGNNWNISNNNFPRNTGQGTTSPSWTIVAVDGLTMLNNTGPTIIHDNNYFLLPERKIGVGSTRCTNITLAGNDGGALMIGTGANDSIDPRL